MVATNLQFAHTDADAFLGLHALPIDFDLAGDNVVVSGISQEKIYVYRIQFVVSADTVITMKNGPSLSLTGPMTFFSGGTYVLDISTIPWYQTSEGNDFIISSTNMVQVSGTVYYQQK